MQVPALPSVDCAILHDEFKPVGGDEIFEAIKQLSRVLKFAPEVQLMASSSRKDIHVHAGGNRILVSQNEQPLEMDGFRSALSTPYTGILLPDAHDIVSRHRANTFVTIGKGMLGNLPDTYYETLGMQPEGFKSPDEIQRATEFCRALTELIIKQHPATALHWGMSDNLVPQSFFENACAGNDLTLLNVRPFITSSSGRLGEGLPIGMYVNGSQWLIGKMIEVEEAPVPLSWMMEMVLAFIRFCQLRGAIIQHNQSFSVEGQDWTVGVYHEKIEGHVAWEKVRLVIVDAPEFGIHGDTSAKRYTTYENEVEVRARAEEEKAELNASNDPQPAARRPERSYNVSDLREFAKRSAASNTTRAVPSPKSRSLLARARGLLLKDR